VPPEVELDHANRIERLVRGQPGRLGRDRAAQRRARRSRYQGFQESVMASGDKSRRVAVKDDDQTVAAAEGARCEEGIIRTSLLPSSRHTASGGYASGPNAP
jgi:hypothetical protein